MEFAEYLRGKRVLIFPDYVVYSIPSATFTEEFGDPLDATFINPLDDLGRILNNGDSGEIVLADLKGFARTCFAQIFCNKYKTFALPPSRSADAAHRLAFVCHRHRTGSLASMPSHRG